MLTFVFRLQIKLKIQNDKAYLFPDPFMMDWDSLSENELKRLVSQLEKTRDRFYKTPFSAEIMSANFSSSNNGQLCTQK
jgi:hypothetical protein